MRYQDYTTVADDTIIEGLDMAGLAIGDLLNRALEKAYDEALERGQKEGYTAGYQARAVE